MLIDRRNWPAHRPWVFLVLIVVLPASLWYFFVAAGADHWPGGSSLPGFAFGLLGGLICLFEMLLWARKQVRSWRIGRVQSWLRAHIWLGLLSVPLVVLHTGFRLGGSLSTLLAVLFLLVILSGVTGLIAQQSLPRRMLLDVPGETVFAQIDAVAGQLVREAERAVETVCGVWQRGAGDKATLKPAEPIPGAELLRDFLRYSLVPYLLQGDRIDSPLRFPAGVASQFRDLRATLPPAARPVVDALETCCSQRRQLDEQRRLHFWLHSWLWLHLPLSVALIVVMFVHAWVALKYW